jgi:hypothetical protein
MLARQQQIFKFLCRLLIQDFLFSVKQGRSHQSYQISAVSNMHKFRVVDTFHNHMGIGRIDIA